MRSWGGRADLGASFECDHGRLAQLFSNLLGNAISHGAPDAPVHVQATQTAKGLTLAVWNTGEAIPKAMLEKLFLPFHRGQMRPDQQGLGLGLFISSEIARAHGGEITVTSSAEETRFTATIPSPPHPSASPSASTAPP